MNLACAHQPLTVPTPLWTVEHPHHSEPILVIRTGSCRHLGEMCALLEFDGELDAYTTNNVNHVIRSVPWSDQSIVVDLSAVSFIDASGWRVIDDLFDETRTPPSKVWLHDPSRTVRRLASILGDDRHQICTPTTSHTEASDGRHDGLRTRGGAAAG